MLLSDRITVGSDECLQSNNGHDSCLDDSETALSIISISLHALLIGTMVPVGIYIFSESVEANYSAYRTPRKTGQWPNRLAFTNDCSGIVTHSNTDTSV